jgi:hypothetical protein
MRPMKSESLCQTSETRNVRLIVSIQSSNKHADFTYVGSKAPSTRPKMAVIMTPVIPLLFDPRALITPNKLNSSTSSSTSASTPDSLASCSLILSSPYFGRSLCSMTNSRATRSIQQSEMQNRKGAFQPKWVYRDPPIGGACWSAHPAITVRRTDDEKANRGAGHGESNLTTDVLLGYVLASKDQSPLHSPLAGVH